MNRALGGSAGAFRRRTSPGAEACGEHTRYYGGRQVGYLRRSLPSEWCGTSATVIWQKSGATLAACPLRGVFVVSPSDQEVRGSSLVDRVDLFSSLMQ